MYDSNNANFIYEAQTQLQQRIAKTDSLSDQLKKNYSQYSSKIKQILFLVILCSFVIVLLLAMLKTDFILYFFQTRDLNINSIIVRITFLCAIIYISLRIYNNTNRVIMITRIDGHLQKLKNIRKNLNETNDNINVIMDKVTGLIFGSKNEIIKTRNNIDSEIENYSKIIKTYSNLNSNGLMSLCSVFHWITAILFSFIFLFISTPFAAGRFVENIIFPSIYIMSFLFIFLVLMTVYPFRPVVGKNSNKFNLKEYFSIGQAFLGIITGYGLGFFVSLFSGILISIISQNFIISDISEIVIGEIISADFMLTNFSLIIRILFPITGFFINGYHVSRRKFSIPFGSFGFVICGLIGIIPGVLILVFTKTTSSFTDLQILRIFSLSMTICAFTGLALIGIESVIRKNIVSGFGFLIQLGITIAFFYILWGTKLLFNLTGVKEILIISGVLSLVYGITSLLFRRGSLPNTGFNLNGIGSLPWGVFFLLVIGLTTSVTAGVWSGSSIPSSIIAVIAGLVIFFIVFLITKKIIGSIIINVIISIIAGCISKFNPSFNTPLFFIIISLPSIPGIFLIYIAEKIKTPDSQSPNMKKIVLMSIFIILLSLSAEYLISKNQNLSMAILGNLKITEENFEYETIDEYIKITGYKGNSTEVEIPENINGKSVAVIGTQAFRGKNLTEAIIPNSTKLIENGAFMENDLVAIIIPDSVESIEHSAFLDNPILSIKIGSNVKLGSDNVQSLGILGRNTGFNTIYDNNGSRAGTYTRQNTNSTAWTVD